MTIEEQFRAAIRTVPDFPQKGILFRDITPVLANPDLSKAVLEELKKRWHGVQIDAVAGIESRGFLFGMGLAGLLGVPFVPLRKVGKLPGDTFTSEYQLEYGSATLEMQKGVIQPGWQVLIHDDLLATAGTANAAADLIQQGSGQLAGFSFLIELAFFKGSELLARHNARVDCLTQF